MFSPSIAFVDLETTGTLAAGDRITEVGIVRVDNGTQVSEWNSLVNPECSIPGAIQALTGISNAMVARAPTFAQVAEEVSQRISGCVFVAHNARFDYAFLKHEFARLGRSFSAKALCTVKLSRRLYPDAPRHNLDSLIERHQLDGADRHRALGDARLLWQFMQVLYRARPVDEIEAAVARILKTPSLPPQLAPDTLDKLPECPGVYRFYGLNTLPLYVGKSINLRERIAAHFSSDYRSANDLRLSAEIRRIECEETAGELGALLREAQLIKTLFPAYNQRLRRHVDRVALVVPEAPGPLEFVPSSGIEPDCMNGHYGPFSSRRQARETLRNLARDARLCWTMLGLEHRRGPCFARQVGKCGGACVGAESVATHHARLLLALARFSLPSWPYPKLVGIRETNVLSGLTEVHVVSKGCWLGTARDDATLQELREYPPRGEFDLEIYRVLLAHIKRKGRQCVLPLE